LPGRGKFIKQLFAKSSKFKKNTVKEILLYQLKAVSSQADWFVPLETAIEGITSAQAAAKNNQQNNSIEEIVHHLIYWNELYLNRFKDPGFSFSEIANDEKFKNRFGLTWEQACKKIENIFDEWINCIAGADDTMLNSTIANKGKTWNTMICNLISHTAYHTGQIITLRKEYNCWDAAKGVN
jgi:uncharacterized damage-inducible protein DinB